MQNNNRRRLRRRPKGAALRAAPLGVVVFRLVRISLVFAYFGAPKFREIWPPTKTLRVYFSNSILLTVYFRTPKLVCIVMGTYPVVLKPY